MTRKRLKELVITPEELKAPTKPRPARKVIEKRITHWQKFAHRHIDATAAKTTMKSEREDREEESAEEFEEESAEEFNARREAFIDEVRELLSERLGRQGKAKQVLERLASIQSRLDAFDSSREPGELMEAIREAMWGWDDVEALTMWIYEHEIWIGPERRREGASKGGQIRAGKTKSRNIKMAEEFRRRRATSNKSDTALMAEIGKKHELLPRQSIAMITRELGRKK